MLARLKEHLSRFADAQCRLVWDNRPSYYITVILPDREGFNKVVHNPSVAGYYMPGEKSLISLDIGQTLDHEFTHALHYADQDFKRIKAPTYIVEGFATLLQSSGMVGEDIVPRRTSGRFYEIREEVRRGEHTPWSRFCVMSYHQYHQKNRSMNYAQSRYMFVYLFETGRLRKWYLNYCEMYHRDQTGRAAWERTFCKPFGEIEKEWVEWLLSIKTAPRKVEKLGCPYLGVEWEDAENGVALYRVDLDSPADKSGLRDGDFLTHADGKEIRTYNDLIDFLNAHEPGDKVNLKVLRGAKELAVTVVLTEHP